MDWVVCSDMECVEGVGVTDVNGERVTVDDDVIAATAQTSGSRVSKYCRLDVHSGCPGFRAR